MKYKLVLLLSVLLGINVVHAQWHFTITSMNYNDNCSSFGASVEVSIRMGMAEQQAAKTYSTKEDCERGRSAANMNYSSGGCYLRITTSPCTGGNIGGGGIGGDGFQAGSLYNSIAIGENYFTPNVAHSIPDQGRELEIKLEALNKQFQNAKNGIKTGDRSFDKTYRKQSNGVPKDNNEKNDNLYAFYPRTRNLIKENDFSDGTGGPIVPIDSIRMKNQEWEEMMEKRVLIDRIIENENESSIADGLSDLYRVGSGYIRDINRGVDYINERFGVTVPGSQQLNDFTNYLDQADNAMIVSGKALVGDFLGAVTDVGNQILDATEQYTVKWLEPISEIIEGTITTGSNTFIMVKNTLSGGNLYRKTSVSWSKTVLNGSWDVLNGGDPEKFYRALNKRGYKTEKDLSKWFKSKNKSIELIRQKEEGKNEKQ